MFTSKFYKTGADKNNVLHFPLISNGSLYILVGKVASISIDWNRMRRSKLIAKY